MRGRGAKALLQFSAEESPAPIPIEDRMPKEELVRDSAGGPLLGRSWDQIHLDFRKSNCEAECEYTDRPNVPHSFQPSARTPVVDPDCAHTVSVCISGPMGLAPPLHTSPG